MEVQNCPKCHGVYSGSAEYCEKCDKAEEDQYFQVREYLMNNPGSTASQIAEKTGVPVVEILKLIRQGSLQNKNE